MVLSKGKTVRVKNSQLSKRTRFTYILFTFYQKVKNTSKHEFNKLNIEWWEEQKANREYKNHKYLN